MFAVSISRKGWCFSFWPEAKEQLMQAVLCGDNHSGLTQGTSQKGLVPVLPPAPGTAQPPSAKGSNTINRERQLQALGCLTQVDAYCSQVLCPHPIILSSFLFAFLHLHFFHSVSVEGLNSGCKIAVLMCISAVLTHSSGLALCPHRRNGFNSTIQKYFWMFTVIRGI